jgi:hypothetical protein
MRVLSVSFALLLYGLLLLVVLGLFFSTPFR